MASVQKKLNVDDLPDEQGRDVRANGFTKFQRRQIEEAATTKEPIACNIPPFSYQRSPFDPVLCYIASFQPTRIRSQFTG